MRVLVRAYLRVRASLRSCGVKAKLLEAHGAVTVRSLHGPCLGRCSAILEALEASPYISDVLLFTIPSSAVPEEVLTFLLRSAAVRRRRAVGPIRAYDSRVRHCPVCNLVATLSSMASRSDTAR